MKALHDQATSLEEQLETRKVVDRAKGKLMDDHGLSEGSRVLVHPEDGDARAPHDEGDRRSRPRRRRSTPGRRSTAVTALGRYRGRQMSDTPPTLMLIDGNSLTYRAFFALPTDMATASGQVTNAVFGFTSMLINLLRDHPPDGLAVAFDRPEPTFRHERVETYKANRSAAPDILRQQMGLVRQVIDTLEIPTLEQAGVEADDIIATLATRARDDGRRRHHRHRRPRQLPAGRGPRHQGPLQPARRVRLRVLRRGRHRGAHRRAPDRATSSTPRCAATRPTTCPACPGVGEKTAAKLINKYGGLDGIFAHLDEQTPKLPPEPGRARGPGPRERRGDGAAARRRARRRDRRPRDGRLRRRGGPQALRLPRVPHALRPAGRGARDRPRSHRGQRGRGARGRGHAGHRAGRGGRAARAAGQGRRPARGRGRLRGRAVLVRRPARAWPWSSTPTAAEVAWLPVAVLDDADGARRAAPRCSARAAARWPPTTPSRCSPGCCAPAGPRPSSASTPRSPPT